MGASLRYLSQRYSMPDAVTKGILTDIGTEELGHLEMVGTIVHQLTNGVGAKDFDAAGAGAYYISNGNGVYPQNASGTPFSAMAISSKSDVIANLVENMAADGAITKEQHF